jgi:hypothetical protein
LALDPARDDCMVGFRIRRASNTKNALSTPIMDFDITLEIASRSGSLEFD